MHEFPIPVPLPVPYHEKEAALYLRERNKYCCGASKFRQVKRLEGDKDACPLRRQAGTMRD